MHLTIVKLLGANESSFFDFARLINKYFSFIELLLITYESVSSSQAALCKQIINQDLELCDLYNYQQFYTKDNSYYFLLGKHEYIRFRDFYQLVNQELKADNYLLPCYSVSDYYDNSFYQPRLFKKNYFTANYNDLLSSKLNYPIFKTRPEKNQNLKFFDSFYEQNAYSELVEQQSMANLLCLNHLEGKALNIYQKLLQQSDEPELKIKITLNLLLIYEKLGLEQAYHELLQQVKEQKNLHPYLNYLLTNKFEPSSLLTLIKSEALNNSQIRVKLKNILLKGKKTLNTWCLAHYLLPKDPHILENYYQNCLTAKQEKALELTVIITSCNNSDFLIKNIKYLVVNTSCNFKLIVVEDGEISMLAQEFYKQNPWIKVIHNQKNLGFVKSVNRAWQIADTPFILLLNDDCLILPGAVTQLLNVLKNEANLALVGPRQVEPLAEHQNIIPAMILPDYQPLFSLYQEALFPEYEVESDVSHLSGFCLLIRKEMAEQIAFGYGLLDEIYGFGYYDDFDLCQRLKKQGYRLKIVNNAFVYHHGSIAVTKAGIKRKRLSERNKRIFMKKWFPKIKIPEPAISLCMIVKNEADNLEKCLKSIEQLCDEIIVVDTGSTDDTLPIAEKYGALIKHFIWENDFARARNESLRHASGRWILWLDADDYLDETAIDKIRKFIQQDKFIVARMPVILYKGQEQSEVLYQYRLFKNKQNIIFQGFIHEAPVNFLPAQVKDLKANIFHTGYAEPTLELNKEKRNIQIIKEHLQKNPEDIRTYLLYMKSLEHLQKWQLLSEIISDFIKRFALTEKNKIIFYQVYLYWSKVLLVKKNYAEAVKKGFMAVDLFPGLAKAYMLLALIFETINEYEYAIAYYQQVLQLELPKFDDEDIDLWKYRFLPYKYLAGLYQKLDDPLKADYYLTQANLIRQKRTD